MGVKEEIKSYIIKQGFTITQVVDELNKRNNTNYSLQNFSKKLNSETLRYSEIKEVADIIGLKIEWILK